MKSIALPVAEHDRLAVLDRVFRSGLPAGPILNQCCAIAAGVFQTPMPNWPGWRTDLCSRDASKYDLAVLKNMGRLIEAESRGISIQSKTRGFGFHEGASTDGA
jgi:hypothetical protein